MIRSITIAFLVILAQAPEAEKAFLGVQLEKLTEDKAKEAGIAGGVLVKGTLDESPAEDMGLTEGDVIVAVDGKAVADLDALQAAFKPHAPGDKVAIEVVRGKEHRRLDGQFSTQKAYAAALDGRREKRLLGTAAKDPPCASWIGTETRVSSLRGKVVVLIFFEITSGESISFAVPLVQEVAEAHKDRSDFRVVGIHTVIGQGYEDTPGRVKEFAKANGIRFPIGLAVEKAEGAAPEATDLYKFDHTPCLVVVDKEGKVRLRKSGRFNRILLTDLVEELLGRK